MCVNLPSKLPNDDFNVLVRLSRSSGVPISQIAGILICHVLDERDPSYLEDVIRRDLIMYRNQLTIRSAILTQNGDLLPKSQEVTINE